MRAPDDAPVHFIAQVQDISARKVAEQALRASEERFQLVVQGTHDGICDWFIETDHCYYSPRYRELLGCGELDLPPSTARSPATCTQRTNPASRKRYKRI